MYILYIYILAGQKLNLLIFTKVGVFLGQLYRRFAIVEERITVITALSLTPISI